jgi:hypothetical protein
MIKQEFNAIDKTRQREYWSEHIQKWKLSNLKQQAYCLEAGISYSSFVYWKGALSPKEPQSIQKAFVPVKVASTEPEIKKVSSEITIKLTTGHVVCIPLTMELEKISKLIHLLGIAHA